jgi:hypothetical protein
MANRRHVKLIVATLLVAPLLVVGVSQTLTRKWQVLDVSRDPPLPIAGALVLAVAETVDWVPGHASTFCSRADVFHSDAAGFVDLPRGRSVVAHKPGHAEPSTGIRDDRHGHIYLTSKPSRTELYNHFAAITGVSGICLGESPAVGEMLRYVISDVRAFAQSPREIELKENMEAGLKYEERRK